MRISLLQIILLIFIPVLLIGQKQYVRVKAKSGDGIYVLLGRYGLDRQQCNIDRFCELNNLTLKSYLITGKTYSLPIEKYVYDGNSIKSSMNLQDSYLAKQIERYNRSMFSFRLKSEDYTGGSRELWCPHHLLACNNNPEKHVPNNSYYEIFGAKYAEVTLEDKSLAGAVYYIVAGHGGPDPGAMAMESGRKICEDEYAYDISLRLGRELIRRGAIVHFIVEDKDGIRDTEILSCDGDEKARGGLSIPFDQTERLQQRSDIINNLYRNYKNKGFDYQRTIEIHIDSRKQNQRVDLFFYYFPNSSIGKSLAELLYKTVKSKYAIYRKSGEYDGTVTPRDLHVLRETIPTSVFVEVANIQNDQDRQSILLPSNRQFLAEWLAEGLMKDY
jgi:N-acetylmuramoyl-L-alanine amidase